MIVKMSNSTCQEYCGLMDASLAAKGWMYCVQRTETCQYVVVSITQRASAHIARIAYRVLCRKESCVGDEHNEQSSPRKSTKVVDESKFDDSRTPKFIMRV